MTEGAREERTPDQQQPVTPEMLDAGKHAREGWLRFQDDLLDKVARLERELEELRADVREWLCVNCNTVHPGPPQPGVKCVICPKCGGDTGPRTRMELRQARLDLEKAEGLAAEFMGMYSGVSDERDEARAQAEEARQRTETWIQRFDELAEQHNAALADLAEARQERERFEALALTNAKAADRNAARIQTLEAALREIRDGTWNHARVGKLLTAHEFARAALQPTTDQEGALPEPTRPDPVEPRL